MYATGYLNSSGSSSETVLISCDAGAEQADLVHDLQQVLLGKRIPVCPGRPPAIPVAARRGLVVQPDEREASVVSERWASRETRPGPLATEPKVLPERGHRERQHAEDEEPFRRRSTRVQAGGAPRRRRSLRSAAWSSLPRVRRWPRCRRFGELPLGVDQFRRRRFRIPEAPTGSDSAACRSSCRDTDGRHLLTEVCVSQRPVCHSSTVEPSFLVISPNFFSTRTR